jgi:hypothetical protein
VVNVFIDKNKPTPVENGNLVIGNLLNAKSGGSQEGKYY